MQNKTALFIALALASAATAEKLNYTSYYFSDNRDNSVFTTSFNLAKNVAAKTVLLMDIELDEVTVAPIDGTTGASRPIRRQNEPYVKNRGQVIIGVERAINDDLSASGSIYSSQETDYRSQALIGSVTREFLQKNFTLSAKAQYTRDQVGEIGVDANTFYAKSTAQAALTATQVLTPTALASFTYEGIRSTGFLSDPYRTVSLVSAAAVDEIHPSSRLRHAGTVRVQQYYAPIEASLIASYRMYLDDWNVHSNTLYLKGNKYIVKDLIVGAEVRYYSQTAARFYKEVYDPADLFRTGDYKLKPFTSKNFGVSATVMLKALAEKKPGLSFLENASLSLMYFRYFNDLNFEANILQGGIDFSL